MASAAAFPKLRRRLSALHAVIRGDEDAQDLGGPVLAAVVDEDQLEGKCVSSSTSITAPTERRERGLLVSQGNDDRDEGSRASGCARSDRQRLGRPPAHVAWPRPGASPAAGPDPGPAITRPRSRFGTRDVSRPSAPPSDPSKRPCASALFRRPAGVRPNTCHPLPAVVTVEAPAKGSTEVRANSDPLPAAKFHLRPLPTGSCRRRAREP